MTRPLPNIRLKPIGLSDLEIVDFLLDRMTAYSTRVHGVPRMRDGAHHFLTATPPGHGPRSKHVFAVMAALEPMGLVDVIDGYPEPDTAFIGLLAIREDRHMTGLGRRTFELTERFTQERLKARKLRLAVLDTNPVSGFWRKMGFRETGEVRPYAGEAVEADAVLMEKFLPE